MCYSMFFISVVNLIIFINMSYFLIISVIHFSIIFYFISWNIVKCFLVLCTICSPFSTSE
nr:MAG TPA: hypothetical protein [Bacteriophage sp.]